jgi:hypothetical protein
MPSPDGKTCVNYKEPDCRGEQYASFLTGFKCVTCPEHSTPNDHRDACISDTHEHQEVIRGCHCLQRAARPGENTDVPEWKDKDGETLSCINCPIGQVQNPLYEDRCYDPVCPG